MPKKLVNADDIPAILDAAVVGDPRHPPTLPDSEHLELRLRLLRGYALVQQDILHEKKGNLQSNRHFNELGYLARACYAITKDFKCSIRLQEKWWNLKVQLEDDIQAFSPHAVQFTQTASQSYTENLQYYLRLLAARIRHLHTERDCLLMRYQLYQLKEILALIGHRELHSCCQTLKRDILLQSNRIISSPSCYSQIHSATRHLFANPNEERNCE